MYWGGWGCYGTEVSADIPSVALAARHNVATSIRKHGVLAPRIMTSYGIREFKSRLSEILRGLDEEDEVIITRRGRPCARLTSVPHAADDKRSLRSLRGAVAGLPDASYEDFLAIKTLWKPGTPVHGRDETGNESA